MDIQLSLGNWWDLYSKPFLSGLLCIVIFGQAFVVEALWHRAEAFRRPRASISFGSWLFMGTLFSALVFIILGVPIYFLINVVDELPWHSSVLLVGIAVFTYRNLYNGMLAEYHSRDAVAHVQEVLRRREATWLQTGTDELGNK